MKLRFDDEKWQELQENLHVAQLCGENAGKVYGYAKGALQRAVAALVGSRDASPEEASHALELVRSLRNSTQDAANGYRVAVAVLDEAIGHLESAGARRRREVTSV